MSRASARSQITPMNDHAEQLTKLRQNLQSVIFGKDEALELLLVALFAGGNILLDDVPGVGKTTMAKALAQTLDPSFQRIQFTPDLLPTDILGGSLFSPKTGEFSFRAGPIFANILLADEINRASPRTQSALLEAMAEGHATIEGEEHALPQPFLVLATQNPVEFHGTYPLPEAQLDRFLLRLEIGYPNEGPETNLLYAQQDQHPLHALTSVMDESTVRAIQQEVRRVRVDREVGGYIITLVRASRVDPRVSLGASPRAALALFRAAQSSACLQGRDFATPDDVKRLAAPVLAHRLALTRQARNATAEKVEVVRSLLETERAPV